MGCDNIILDANYQEKRFGVDMSLNLG